MGASNSSSRRLKLSALADGVLKLSQAALARRAGSHTGAEAGNVRDGCKEACGGGGCEEGLTGFGGHLGLLGHTGLKACGALVECCAVGYITAANVVHRGVEGGLGAGGAGGEAAGVVGAVVAGRTSTIGSGTGHAIASNADCRGQTGVRGRGQQEQGYGLSVHLCRRDTWQ